MPNLDDIAELSDHVLLLLRQKRLMLKTSFEYDVLSSHTQALQILSKHKSLAVGEIKTKLRLSFGSTTKIIDSLEQKKLVSRKKFVKSDLRSTEVFLTQKGRTVVQEIEEKFVSFLRACFSETASEHKKILLHGIKALLRQLGGHESNTPKFDRKEPKRMERLTKRSVSSGQSI